MTCDVLSDSKTQCFPGDSELATRMRAFNWSQTPLGAVETWPQSLCTSVSTCLQSRFPMLIMWGCELVMLYNDAYRSILGSRKHPQALGQRGRECWREVWEVIGPRLESVLTQGEATWFEDALFLVDRNGYLEECYFTLSHSPILDETGSVGGIFMAVTETTKHVLSERRLSTLSELAAQTAGLTTVAAVCAASVAVLAKNPNDLPFALLYSVDPATEQASLTTAIGLTPGTELSPLEVNYADAETDLSRCFKQVLETGQLQTFDLTDRIDRIDWSSQSLEIVPETAVVVPVAQLVQAGLAYICVVSVSPRQALNRDYQNFLELFAGQLSRAIANARSLEEEHKRAASLAEIDLAKTVFFSNVSHEFRTPLTLMLGPLEELSDLLTDRLQPAEREQLQLIWRNGIRLQKLVNTLLDFSRIEAGRIQVSYESTDLAIYTAELASMFRSLIEQAEMELEIDCPPLPVNVYVDRQMWEKIVFNLISNAFKFTFSGTISVRLQAVGDVVKFSVRDTGVGIPTAELPRLFERFYRVSGMKSRTYEGSGIGLAFVKRLVELHQGSIDVTSVEGEGTCFTITIPTGTAHLPPDRIGAIRTLISTALSANAYVEEAANWISSDTPRLSAVSPELIVQSSIQLVLDPQPTRTPRILIADDNADLRDYLRRLLSPQYQVVAVADGVAALAAIRHQMPDLVLSDVMMPNLDGLSLLQTLRSDPQIREIPMILLSARTGEEARLEGLAAGADDYLTKPFSARELLVRVEVTLKLAQMRRAATQQEQILRLEAETANRTKDEFLSMVSHELRSPLTAILGWAQLLQRQNFDIVKTNQALKTIENSAKAQDRLIKDLLDVSAIVAGKVQLETSVFQLGSVIEMAIATVQLAAAAKQIELTFSTEDTTETIVGDPDRIEQIISNLLLNAIKFTPTGGRIDLKLTYLETQAQIDISDTGSGLSADFLPYVFNRWSQAAPKDKKNSGLGLGLSIVRSLVELHGGTITVASPGEAQGSTFTVSLPLKTPPRGEPQNNGCTQTTKHIKAKILAQSWL